jgi:Uma2 family endonuclease
MSSPTAPSSVEFPSLLLLPPAADGRARFSRKAYHRMSDVLNSGPRVELIDGEIFMMSPIGPTRGMLISRLDYFFTRNLPSEFRCRVQLPIAARDDSEPEPDISIVRWRDDDYANEHPTPADVVLIIEVAQSSLPFDLGRKLRLYASIAVSEYWVVDVANRRVIVHREPSTTACQGNTAFESGTHIAPLAAPSCELDLTWLFR